jgi:hypothetical protein
MKIVDQLDGISLEQSLVDFEVANARVLDLTRRLTSLNAQLMETRTELEQVKLRYAQAQQISTASSQATGPGGMTPAEAFERIAQLKRSRTFAWACLFSGRLRKVLL